MARNRNRQPGPTRRTIIAARPDPTAGTSPALRAPSCRVDHAFGPVRRTRNVSYAGSGTDGYNSAWAASPEFFTDPRWSQTVSNQTV